MKSFEATITEAKLDLQAGHRPPIRGLPGNFALNSTIPPVKQNLFQP